MTNKASLTKSYKERIEWAAKELVANGAEPIYVIGLKERGVRLLSLSDIRGIPAAFEVFKYALAVFARDATVRYGNEGRQAKPVKTSAKRWGEDETRTESLEAHRRGDSEDQPAAQVETDSAGAKTQSHRQASEAGI